MTNRVTNTSPKVLATKTSDRVTRRPPGPRRWPARPAARRPARGGVRTERHGLVRAVEVAAAGDQQAELAGQAAQVRAGRRRRGRRGRPRARTARPSASSAYRLSGTVRPRAAAPGCAKTRHPAGGRAPARRPPRRPARPCPRQCRPPVPIQSGVKASATRGDQAALDQGLRDVRPADRAGGQPLTCSQVTPGAGCRERGRPSARPGSAGSRAARAGRRRTPARPGRTGRPAGAG